MNVLRKVGMVLGGTVLLVLLALPAFANGSQESSSSQGSAAAGAGGKVTVAMVSKGFQFQYWQTVMHGAQAAAKKLGVDMTFDGPPSEADIQQQVQMLQTAMAENPSAIGLAALDTNSVIDLLNQAIQRHIPIVGFDSGVPNAPKGAIFATAATNNAAAAGIAADHMFQALKDKIAAATNSSPVTIVVFNQDATSESITDRGNGFRDEMIQLIETKANRSASDIKVTGNPAYISANSPTGGQAVIIDEVVPASARTPDVTTSAQAILNRVKSDNVAGIFCSNQGTVEGFLAATNDGSALPAQYPGLVVVGFDAGQGQKDAVRHQYFLGSITQDPYMIGYDTIELAYKAVKGEPVANVDTGAHFYDSTNIDDPNIAQLLYN